MGRGTWIAGVVLAGALTGWTEAAAETLSALTVRVKVLDSAKVPADTLREAQGEASRIFERAGISLAWIPADQPSAGSLLVRILPAPITGIPVNEAVMGVAAGGKQGGRVAFLLYDRITKMRERFGLGAPQMLGYVIAHEMGHLLLGRGSHSAAGIMKKGWDREQTTAALSGVLGFHADQVKRIRRLEAHR